MENENYYTSRARVNNQVNRDFIKWLLKVRAQMVDLSFDIKYVKRYEENSSKTALWAGTPPRRFLKYLDDKKKLRIAKLLRIT